MNPIGFAIWRLMMMLEATNFLAAYRRQEVARDLLPASIHV
ncbi:MAG: hypothetical protein QM706_12040 [Nitrospira sp.]